MIHAIRQTSFMVKCFMQLMTLFILLTLSAISIADDNSSCNATYTFLENDQIMTNQDFSLSNNDACFAPASPSFQLRDDSMPPNITSRNPDLSTGDDNPYVYPNLNIDR